MMEYSIMKDGIFRFSFLELNQQIPHQKKRTTMAARKHLQIVSDEGNTSFYAVQGGDLVRRKMGSEEKSVERKTGNIIHIVGFCKLGLMVLTCDGQILVSPQNTPQPVWFALPLDFVVQDAILFRDDQLAMVSNAGRLLFWQTPFYGHPIDLIDTACEVLWVATIPNGDLFVGLADEGVLAWRHYGAHSPQRLVSVGSGIVSISMIRNELAIHTMDGNLITFPDHRGSTSVMVRDGGVVISFSAYYFFADKGYSCVVLNDMTAHVWGTSRELQFFAKVADNIIDCECSEAGILLHHQDGRMLFNSNMTDATRKGLGQFNFV